MAESQTKPVKVILWAVPRTMSTSFLKSMTFAPDTVAWMEPWRQVLIYGKDSEGQSPFSSKLIEKMGGQAALDDIPGGFDALDKTFEWLKNQLEGDFPGKKLVFVKELTAFTIGKEDSIPQGFRHTFLIRHPARVVASFYKFMAKHKAANSGAPKSPELMAQVNKNFKIPHTYKSYELLQYIKEHHEPNPIVIDADDFLQSPAKMLEAYCKAVGIPYSPDLLTWEAGDEVMTKHWMVSKQMILTSPTFGAHDGTWKSTGFLEQEKQPLPDLSKFPPEAAKLVAIDLPYYEKMYAERLILE